MRAPIVDPQSESEILRASSILLIQLRDVTFGPWVKEEVGDLMRRDVTMQVVIEEVLKGKVRQNVGEPFELKVQQRGTGGFRVADYYGLWSHVPLADGVRFVAFCPGTLDEATVLLTEGNCEQLVDPDIALEDTRAALELEAQDLSAADILARARGLAGQRGDVFARYVLARTKPEAISTFDTVQTRAIPSGEVFESLIQLIEDPKTTAQARATYLTSVYEELGMMASPPGEWEIRLIQAMFKLLVLPEAEALHGTIGNVYLPNMLDLDKHPPRYSAEEVFKDRVDERQMILITLEREPKKAFAPRLIKWLAGRET